MSFYVTLVMLVSLGIISLVFTISERQKTSRDIIRSGEIFASFSTRKIYDDYVQYYTHPRPEDFENFKDLVQNTLKNNPDVIGVSMIALNGRILFDSEEFKTGKATEERSVVDEELLMMIKAEEISSRTIDSKTDGRATEIIVPLQEAGGGHILAMRYLISNQSLNTRMNEVYRQIAAVIIPLMICVVLLATFYATIFTRPIIRLTQTADQIRNGNFGVQAPVRSNDEIGSLTETFNQMSTKLKDYYRNLEMKVNERTLDLEKTKSELEERQVAILNVLEDARELESSLKEEKNRTELIVSYMGEGLLVVDKEFNVAAINPTAERLMAVSQRATIGQPWAKIISAYQGDTEIPFEQRTSVLVIKKGVTIPTRLEDNHYYLTVTGRKFPVVSVTSPITREGKIVGAVKVFRDATAEKESKAIIERTVQERTRELAQEQALSNSILEHAGEGIVLTNDAGLVTYVNPAFTKMVGYKIEDLKGKSFASEIKAFDLKEELIPPSQRSDAAAVTAENQEVKMFLETTTKEKRAVVSNAAPIRVEGEFKGVVRILHDYNEDLALQRQKDDFFSIASHELRTPLSVISGNLDTILAGYGQNQLGPEDTQLLKDSLTASERLIKIVEDFLNVSRLDQGRLTFSIQPVDYCKIFEDVVSELKSLADHKGVALELFCPAKNTMVMADEGLLREILTNLIGNSLKFTEKGVIKIEGHIKGQMLETVITDTGMGISPEMQGLLFQRFQQAMKRTLNREAGGTGLGLFISREFARKMGGDLWLVKSEPGQGSVFAFSLPLAEDGREY